MAITFEIVTDEVKMQAADLLLKIESLDSALADIQTDRAKSEVGWAADEQEIKTEKSLITEKIRQLQRATLVSEMNMQR